MTALIALSLAAACAEPASPKRQIAGADPENGLRLIRLSGCAACHAIPGVDWPKGATGGPLKDFADRPLIAGRLPNRPEILVAWIRDPPALSPSTAMPPSALGEAGARDVAAYLYTLHGR